MITNKLYKTIKTTQTIRFPYIIQVIFSMFLCDGLDGLSGFTNIWGKQSRN